MSDPCLSSPVLVHPVAPVHRIIVAPGFAPVLAGQDSPAVTVKFPQQFRILWLSALCAGADPGEGLNSLALQIKTSIDDGSIFMEGKSAGFVPFAHLVGQNGARVLPFDPSEDSRTLVGPEVEWSLVVRNLDASRTFTPSVTLGVLCGWGSCVPKGCR